MWINSFRIICSVKLENCIAVKTGSESKENSGKAREKRRVQPWSGPCCTCVCGRDTSGQAICGVLRSWVSAAIHTHMHHWALPASSIPAGMSVLFCFCHTQVVVNCTACAVGQSQLDFCSVNVSTQTDTRTHTHIRRCKIDTGSALELLPYFSTRAIIPSLLTCTSWPLS